MPPHIAATLTAAEIAPPPVQSEIVKPRPAPVPPSRFMIERAGARVREIDTLTGEVIADFEIEARR